MTTNEMAELTEINETSSMLKSILNVYSSRQTNPYHCTFSQKVKGKKIVISATIEIETSSPNVLNIFKGAK